MTSPELAGRSTVSPAAPAARQRSKRDRPRHHGDDLFAAQLARTVKARYPHIPIVLTTGYARVFDAEPEFPVLRKPYQISALGRIIREAIDGAASKRTALAS